MFIPLLAIALMCNATSLIMAGRSCCGNKKPSARYSKQAKIKSQAAADIAPQQALVHEVSSESDYRAQIKEPLVVVKFYSNGCPHCRAMAPVFIEIAQKHPDVVFLNLDVDNPALSSIADERNIDSIPAFAFFKNGALVDTKIGTYKSGSFDKVISDFKASQKKPAARVEPETRSKPQEKKKPTPRVEKPEPVKQIEEKIKPAGQVNEITSLAEYKSIVGSGKPAIIEVYTDWCGACKDYVKLLKKIAPQYSGKVDFYKFDAEKHDLQDIAKQYASGGYPTTLYVNGGVVKDTTVGTRTEKMLRDSIAKLVK